MFVGRSKELKKLQKLYESDSFEFAVFYGRRQKTTLIKIYKDKKASTTCCGRPRKENLADFQGHFCQTDRGPSVSRFESLLGYIDQLAVTGREDMPLEFPYLASYPAISSMFKAILISLENSHFDLCAHP